MLSVRMASGAVPQGARWEVVDAFAERWLRRKSTKLLRHNLASAFGEGKSIRAVEIYDGKRGDDSTIDRFNMPGTPWVLILVEKPKNRLTYIMNAISVVLLDPIWNPAHREQRRTVSCTALVLDSEQ